MTGLSRRSFLGGFIRGRRTVTVDRDPDEWIFIARTAELSPGVPREVDRAELHLTLFSSFTGIRAETEAGKYIALRLGSGGRLFANPAMGWPPSRELSHMTGEAIEVEMNRLNDRGENHD